MENNSRSFTERMNDWMKKSFTFKLVVIAVLILLLMIPMSMIKDTINERNSSKWTAIRDITSKWGAEQQLNGPYLSIPVESWYTRTQKDDKGVWTTEKYSVNRTHHFLPEKLDMDGTLAPEERYRGIYDVVVYKSNLNIAGNFKMPNASDIISKENAIETKIYWDKAQITMGIADLRGLTESIKFKLNGKTKDFEPLAQGYNLVHSGVMVPLKLTNSHATTQQLSFNMDIKLNGSTSIRFVPLGRETKIALKSPWKDPKFGGAFLPDLRVVNEDGFDASWKVLELNRPFPQTFTSNIPKVSDHEVSAELILPVDEYQKSTRSAKYALLLITLTFVTFFFIQVIKGVKMHPFQYLLVGLALSVFYSLLLSLSEVITFNPAYLSAAAATTLLIGAYLKSVFKSTTLALQVSGILTVVYAFIYLIIQQQDYALLMGSVGLFLIIATVMYLSRNVNWFRE